MARLREKLARDKIKVDPDAGPHMLRLTVLTEAGRATDAFTLQYIAGHDTIKTTMRYVHPRAESVSRAFGRVNQKNKPAKSALVRSLGSNFREMRGKLRYVAVSA